MSTYKPKFLTDADIVRTIEPKRLIALLKPYSDYFASRNLSLASGNQANQLDVELLVELLKTPDDDAPQELLNAIGYIDEMATPQGMDALLRAAITDGMAFDVDADQTPADVAVQVWLFDPRIVEEQHAWITWRSPRRMDCFRPINGKRRNLASLTPARIDQATKNLGEYFGGSNRSKYCKLHIRQTEDRIEISVQRGDPFQRRPTIEANSIRNLHFRPAGKDTVVFRLSDHILQCSSTIKRAITIYQRIFGILLFDDPHYFSDAEIFTLAPLHELDEDALSWGDIDEIESIVLVRYRVDRGENNAFETFEADDIFAFRRMKRKLPEINGRLVEATFKIKFRSMRSMRTVKLYEGNAACYTRDGNAVAAELWLILRGFFVCSDAVMGSDIDEKVLASA